MSLYLSRIRLNPLFAPAIRLSASPEDLHRKLCALLPPQVGSADGRSLLFRMDSSEDGPVVLMQTAVEPDWDALELAPRALLSPPETKLFECALDEGQRLGFRLLARPSARVSGDFGRKEDGKRKQGPRRTCRDDDARLAWLKRKGAESGFRIESVGLTVLSIPSIKSNRSPREKGGSFTAVRYDGVLVVTDPEKLKNAVANGVGTQKAFGFGLLSLASLR